MAERDQVDRWRCLTTGCNPVLDEYTATVHRTSTGHRVTNWPIRSAAGKAKAAKRNRNGYYDKYNVGAKSYAARGLGGFGNDNTSDYDPYRDEDDHPFSGEALGQD